MLGNDFWEQWERSSPHWSAEFRLATRLATERAVTEISRWPWPISWVIARFAFASRVERYREQELRRLNGQSHVET